MQPQDNRSGNAAPLERDPLLTDSHRCRRAPTDYNCPTPRFSADHWRFRRVTFTAAIFSSFPDEVFDKDRHNQALR
jgi:hypothetical protein